MVDRLLLSGTRAYYYILQEMIIKLVRASIMIHQLLLKDRQK